MALDKSINHFQTFQSFPTTDGFREWRKQAPARCVWASSHSSSSSNKVASKCSSNSRLSLAKPWVIVHHPSSSRCVLPDMTRTESWQMSWSTARMTHVIQTQGPWTRSVPGRPGVTRPVSPVCHSVRVCLHAGVAVYFEDVKLLSSSRLGGTTWTKMKRDFATKLQSKGSNWQETYRSKSSIASSSKPRLK